MRNDRDENNPQELLAIDRYIDWSRNWQLTPVFLPGKFHGQRKLAGYSPWGCKESDMIEHAHTQLHESVSRSVVSDSFCNPMDCSPPGSSVHGILQARILKRVAISFSRGSSQPRSQTQVSCIAARFVTV